MSLESGSTKMESLAFVIAMLSTDAILFVCACIMGGGTLWVTYILLLACWDFVCFARDRYKAQKRMRKREQKRKEEEEEEEREWLELQHWDEHAPPILKLKRYTLHRVVRDYMAGPDDDSDDDSDDDW